MTLHVKHRFLPSLAAATLFAAVLSPGQAQDSSGTLIVNGNTVQAVIAAILAATLSFNPVPAEAQITNAATTNGSVAITAGNTFQSVLAVMTVSSTTPQTGRRSLTIQNNNTNGDNCWVFVGPNASATKGTAILLAQGASYTRYYPYVPSDNISATCATTADTLYVDTQ